MEHKSLDELGELMVFMRSMHNDVKKTNIFKERFKLIDMIFTRKLIASPRTSANIFDILQIK